MNRELQIEDDHQVLSQRLGEITHTRTHILLELERLVEERTNVDVPRRVCYDLALEFRFQFRDESDHLVKP